MRKAILFLLLQVAVYFQSAAQYSFRRLDVHPTRGAAPRTFTEFKGKTYFVANDDVHGYELWQTDGTVFSIVADLAPGWHSTFIGIRGELVVENNSIYFFALDTFGSCSIYQFDGVGVPQLVVSLPNGLGTVHEVANLRGLKGNLYFCAITPTGYDIYRCDLQTKIVQKATDIQMVGWDEIVSFGGRIYFAGTQARRVVNYIVTIRRQKLPHLLRI